MFVNNKEEVPVGKWLKASAGPPGKDKTKVKSSLGDLAYRPGWHSGDVPVATHIGGKSSNKLKKPDYRPDDQVWAEVEHPADVDWQSVANSRMEYTKQGKPKPVTAHITDQVPYGGHYRYKTNPQMTGNWIISGDMKVNRVLSDDEVEAVNKNAGVADLPRRTKLKLDETNFSAIGGGIRGFGYVTGEGAVEPGDALFDYMRDNIAWADDIKTQIIQLTKHHTSLHNKTVLTTHEPKTIKFVRKR